MNNVSDAYIEGFVKKCEERGVDPEELVKLSQLGLMTPFGTGIRGVREGFMTPQQKAISRHRDVGNYGQKGTLQRFGTALWDPARAIRGARYWRQAGRPQVPQVAAPTQKPIGAMY